MCEWASDKLYSRVWLIGIALLKIPPFALHIESAWLQKQCTSSRQETTCSPQWRVWVYQNPSTLTHVTQPVKNTFNIKTLITLHAPRPRSVARSRPRHSRSRAARFAASCTTSPTRWPTAAARSWSLIGLMLGDAVMSGLLVFWACAQNLQFSLIFSFWLSRIASGRRGWNLDLADNLLWNLSVEIHR